MPGEPQRIYWDSNVFLSYINGIPDRVTVLTRVFDEVRASHGEIEIITSALSMVEVAFSEDERARRRLDQAVERAIEAMWRDTSVIKIVEYYAQIGDDARLLMRRAMAEGNRLTGLDAIHLATAARWSASEFHTYDELLDKFTTAIGIPVVRPRTQHPYTPDFTTLLPNA